MARLSPLLCVLLGCVLAARLALGAIGGWPGHDPVYTVAQVRAGLARDAEVWVGRSVLVRGMADPCPWWGGTIRLWQCADDPLVLGPGPSDPVAEPLPLGLTGEPAALAFLRGLPVLHDLLARSPAVPLFTPSRFRVRLQSLAAQSCGGRSPCYTALLDAASVIP